MWGYYGSKHRLVDNYPRPNYSTIIEPFAGTAPYSLRYWENDIFLYEKYDIIVNLWKWLQNCSKSDILSIRQLKYGESTDDFTWSCEEEKKSCWISYFGVSICTKKDRQ